MQGLSAETIKSATLMEPQKKKNMKLLASFSFFFFFRSSEQTRCASLAQKRFKEHTSAGTPCGTRSSIGCLALHFSHSTLIRALQTSGVICKHKHLVERGGSQALMSPHIIYQPLKEMKRKKKRKRKTPGGLTGTSLLLPIASLLHTTLNCFCVTAVVCNQTRRSEALRCWEVHNPLGLCLR